MRKSVFIFLFFSSIYSYGQDIDLQGVYSANIAGGLAGESIKFIGKDSFYFGRDYCGSRTYGKGKCEIVNNYLYLHFEKTKNKSDSLKANYKINAVQVYVYEIDEISEDVIIMREDDTGQPFTKYQKLE